jgi:hypothetical protein
MWFSIGLANPPTAFFRVTSGVTSFPVVSEPTENLGTDAGTFAVSECFYTLPPVFPCTC